MICVKMTQLVLFVTMVVNLFYVTNAHLHFIRSVLVWSSFLDMVSFCLCGTSLMVTGFVHHVFARFATKLKQKRLRMVVLLLALSVNVNIMSDA